MADDIIFNRLYEPLFRKPDTRYILVKGGRGSGKSYAVATSLLMQTYADALKILYTRYTMTSAEISIIPEYKDKITALHRGTDFTIRMQDITNMATGGQILFRGLLGSSGNQVAKLKSIQGIKTWVLDEAQELTSEEIFETIDYSVRTMEAANLIALVFNPTDVGSWIYKRFYKGVPEGFNGVIDGVRYIDTNYLQNRHNLSQSILDAAEKMRNNDYERYKNIWLGHWSLNKEGIIYRRWTAITAADMPSGPVSFYGVDWGYSNDPSAVVECRYEPLTMTLYVREVLYETGLLAGQIAMIIERDMREHGIGVDAEIYCDPARPEHIGELRMKGLNAIGADNRNKAGRIMYLKYFNVCYAGENIGLEVSAYSYVRDRQDSSRYLNEPEDGNDHLMDAINYAAVTWLRREGVVNMVGEV